MDTVSYILRLTCPDRVGIVAAISRFMEAEDCFIVRSRSFGDEMDGRFFSRLSFRPANSQFDLDRFRVGFEAVAHDLDAEFAIHPEGERVKALIMVSKSDHCANALLYGARSGELAIDPVAIVSNHPDLGPKLAHWGLPYHQVPVTEASKPDAERRLFELVEETGAELVILARYMQVLSDTACRRLEGRCINIHHSFLPSFKGARPYHQAHTRGVKVVGATAHYVTPDLDEGPIITQVVEPVDHTMGPPDLIQIGRHLEAAALSRAVKAHAEQRIFINGAKTVVFA